MRNTFSFIFLILLTANIYSQSSKIIYVDEKNEEIDFIYFKNKLESGLFMQTVIIKDTKICKLLKLKEIFGKLDSKRKTQLNKLFLSRYNTDSTNIWYIHYRTNKLHRSTKSNLKYVFTDSLTNESREGKMEYFTRRISNRYIETNNPDTIEFLFNKKIKFELNRIKNPKNTTILHLDDIKRDSSIVVQGMHNHFYEDYNSIVKIIFNVSFSNNNLIIIHPNGSYYVSKNESGFDKKELFKFKSFKREEKKWRRKYEKVN